MKGPSPVIELEQVSIFYNSIPVIRDFSLSVPKKQVTTLQGPSGCGKSTLLRSLCRMNDRIEGFSIEGSVRVLGKDVYASETDVYQLRRRVGMVFQKPCMFPGSIFDNVVVGLRHHAPDQKKRFPILCEEMLKRVGLWEEVHERLDHRAATLSQGQQQRLSIARALILRPEILLLDEPTSALDEKSAGNIEQLILDLKTTCSLLWVTHQPQQARRISDHVITLAT